MLEALKRQGVTGAATAVARYFGGVKLGAGPLGRAFGLATAQAVAAAEPCVVEKSFLYTISFDYALSGAIERRFQHSPFRLRGLAYGEKIAAEADVRESDVPAFLADMADLSAGRSVPVKLSECYLKW
jgi:putative IMPACT (imprinted ancient) family translation regulator